MNTQRKLTLSRFILCLTILLNLAALYQFIGTAYEAGFWFTSINRKIAAGIFGLLFVVEVILLVMTWTPFRDRLFFALNVVLRGLKRLGVLNLILFVTSVSIFSFVVLGPFGQFFDGIWIRFFFYWVAALIGSLLLTAWGFLNGSSWFTYLGASLIFTAFGYNIAVLLPNISTYPLTIGWSETSRYYYASLFFAREIYQASAPLPVLHPSRYIMQAVPFLIPNSPLWLHRAWQVFLWLATTLMTSALLVRRLKVEKRSRRWLAAIWLYLFLMIGPVYYHLQVPAILILWLFGKSNHRSLWSVHARNLLVVLAASIWAGISRVNWFPVPGLLAASLYFLEFRLGHSPWIPDTITPEPDRPPSARQSIWLYLFPPVLWALIGTGVAFLTQRLYMVWSGNEAEQFGTSFTSDLLWYRLFPNSNFILGILPGIMLVSLPMFLIMAYRLTDRRCGRPDWQIYHPIRLLGLVSVLFVLLAGGLVVSIKIGGGNNLHNLDAYLSLLLVIFAYFYFDRMIPDNLPDGPNLPQEDKANASGEGWRLKAYQAGIVLAILIPSIYTIASAGPTERLPALEHTSRVIKTISKYVKEASQNGGQTLFISNRHLLTFHTVEGIPLVPEYERMFLMEMAMARNYPYLDQFVNDLKNHRFALIISEPLFNQKKDQGETFSEENNAWVVQVSKYILCTYKPAFTDRETGVQILAPNPRPKNCP